MIGRVCAKFKLEIRGLVCACADGRLITAMNAIALSAVTKLNNQFLERVFIDSLQPKTVRVWLLEPSEAWSLALRVDCGSR